MNTGFPNLLEQGKISKTGETKLGTTQENRKFAAKIKHQYYEIPEMKRTFPKLGAFIYYELSKN